MSWFNKKEEKEELHLPPFGSILECPACGGSSFRRKYERETEAFPHHISVICMDCDFFQSEKTKTSFEAIVI